MTEPRRIEPGPVPSREERLARLRETISREAESLIRSLRPAVRSTGGPTDAEAILERATEVFSRAVEFALSHPDRYDPERSAYAWIKGVALTILKGMKRDLARERTRVARQVDLGPHWELVLEIADERSDAVDARIDVGEAMGRLDPASRHALECRFRRGLDGQELADAIGAPSPGAARVRVARAKQKLELLLPRPEPEAHS